LRFFVLCLSFNCFTSICSSLFRKSFSSFVCQSFSVMSSSDSLLATASAATVSASQGAELSSDDLTLRESVLHAIASARESTLARKVAPILMPEGPPLFGVSTLQDWRKVVSDAVMALPVAVRSSQIRAVATALGLEVPLAVGGSDPPVGPQRPAKRPRSSLLSTAFTTVAVVSAALAQRFATASSFQEASSSAEALSPVRQAFARVARKASHQSLQEGSRILVTAHPLDDDELPDAAAFMSSTLLVFLVLATSSGPTDSLVLQFLGVVGDAPSAVSAPAVPRELGIRVGDTVSLSPQPAYLVASPEFLLRFKFAGEDRSLRQRHRTDSVRDEEDQASSEEEDADLDTLLRRFQVAGQVSGRSSRAASVQLAAAAGRGATGKECDAKRESDYRIDEIDGSRVLHLGAVSKDKRLIVVLLLRAPRRALEKRRCAALFQDGHYRHEPFTVGEYVYNQAEAVAHVTAVPVAGAVPLPTHQIWHSAGVLRDFAFLDVRNHRTPSPSSQYSAGELAYLLCFGPTRLGRLSVTRFLANVPAASRLQLPDLREAVRLLVVFLSGYLGVSYVSVGNEWAERMSDPTGSLYRLETRYLVHLVDRIMSCWFDQLSEIPSSTILTSYGIDLAEPTGARDLLLRFVMQDFNPSIEGQTASEHLWSRTEDAPVGAAAAAFTPQALVFSTPSPPPAAAPAPSVRFTAPRVSPSFAVTVSAPPRPAPAASLPASLPSPTPASASVCWQFVGSVIGALNKNKKGAPYECNKGAACAHHHIDAGTFLALPKPDKLAHFDGWKVPAAMKADFAKALQ
jgi:hypothetical protein